MGGPPELASLPAPLPPVEPIRRSVISGKITRIELHIPRVSEKNLQSINAMDTT